MTGLLAPSEALQRDRLGAADQVRFWRAPRLGGLEGLTARFERHRYPRHSHDGYVMGVITAGCERFWCRGATHRAPAGAVCFVNPGDVHDGEPSGGFYAYRMIYPSLDLVAGIAAELTGGAGGTPFFPAPIVLDRELAGTFALLHDRLPDAGCRLGQDEAVTRLIGAALRRHARLGGPEAPAPRGGTGLARVRAAIEERYAEDLDLATLAAEAGLSRWQLIRALKRSSGATPHGLLIDRRVREAQRRLRRGEAPAEVAAACGFSDQSHLSRAFRARLGVTPGMFAGRDRQHRPAGGHDRAHLVGGGPDRPHGAGGAS